jgi:8-oxo-dGTP diphosphatase
MSKPKETRIGCYGMIVENDKILLCRLCDGLHHHGRWTLPGGGLEFGEKLEEAMIREVFEETGLHVVSKGLRIHNSHIWDFPEKTMHSFQFLFDVEITGGQLKNEVDGTTDLADWVLIDDITSENSVDIVLMAKQSLRQTL